MTLILRRLERKNSQMNLPKTMKAKVKKSRFIWVSTFKLQFTIGSAVWNRLSKYSILLKIKM
jgi:hypothetical protein